jgi:hypothetical protein
MSLPSPPLMEFDVLAPVDDVVAAVAIERIETVSAVEKVDARAADEIVVPATAVDLVIAAAAIDLVIAGAGKDGVAVEAPVHHIIAVEGLNQRALAERTKARGRLESEAVAAIEDDRKELCSAVSIGLIDRTGRETVVDRGQRRADRGGLRDARQAQDVGHFAEGRHGIEKGDSAEEHRVGAIDVFEGETVQIG